MKLLIPIAHLECKTPVTPGKSRGDMLRSSALWTLKLIFCFRFCSVLGVAGGRQLLLQMSYFHCLRDGQRKEEKCQGHDTAIHTTITSG